MVPSNIPPFWRRANTQALLTRRGQNQATDVEFTCNGKDRG